MSDPLTSRRKAFLDLYQANLLPVFRYHLLRCGDWQDAQAWTAETFLKAWRWFHEQDGAVSRTWLFRIAVSVYTGLRHPHTLEPLEGGSATPTQDQLAAYARVADLHEGWRRSPRRLQDAVALFLFAGLDIAEVSEVIGWRADQTADRLAPFAAQHSDLRVLAGEIAPVGYFAARLENEIVETVGRGERIRPGLRGPWAWWARYRAGPVLTFLGQALPLVLFGVLFYLGVQSFTRPASNAVVEPERQQSRETRRLILPQSNRQGPALPAGYTQEPSQDWMIYANQAGAVFVKSLQNGDTTRLTEDGFYLFGGDDPLFQPQLSPDGAWLALVSPETGDTWLFGMDGTTRRRIHPRSVRLAWSPDGGEAVYVDPDNPRLIRRFRASLDVPQTVIQMPGEVQSLAWSPDGRMIGVAYMREGPEADQVTTYIGLVNAQGSRRVVLGAQGETIDQVRGGDLYYAHRMVWTEDSSELWYPRWAASFPVGEALGFDLEVSQSGLPVGQYLGVSQQLILPFPINRMVEVENALLTGRPGAVLSDGMVGLAVAPDRRRAARILESPNGDPAIVALYDVETRQNFWIESFGRAERVAWTAEQNLLVVGERINQPGKIFLVDSSNGEHSVIAEDAWLIGTRSEMAYASRNLAPQTVKIPLTGQDLTGPRVSVALPELGISLTLPSHWQVFRGNTVDEGIFISNFGIAEAVGYISLKPDDILIQVGPIFTQSSLEAEIQDIRHEFGDKVLVLEDEIGGLKAYRTYWEIAGPVHEVLFIDAQRYPLQAFYLPGNSSREFIFDEIFASIQLVERDQVRPSAESPRLPEASSVDWIPYRNANLGVAFELPSILDDNAQCRVREGEDALLVGSRILVTRYPLKGNNLEKIIPMLVGMREEDGSISRLEEYQLAGYSAFQMEGSQDVSGFFSMTFIEKGGELYILSYSPSGSCGLPLNGISELQIYRRMVESLTFIN